MRENPRPNSIVESCGSTNDLARALAEQGFPGGTWISSRVQEGGRGRLGRKWESLEGNLFLSMIVRDVPPKLWTWIPLAASVAIAHALLDAYPSLDVRIKWPNDLWARKAKLGGLLCEGVGNARGSYVIIGAGLNCAGSPEGLDQPTTSLSRELGSTVTADLVRDRVIEALRTEVLSLDPSTVSRLRREYERLSAFPSGTEVFWNGKSGKVLEIGEAGELLVTLPNGEIAPLYAEDVKIRANPKGDGGSPA